MFRDKCNDVKILSVLSVYVTNAPVLLCFFSLSATGSISTVAEAQSTKEIPICINV